MLAELRDDLKEYPKREEMDRLKFEVGRLSLDQTKHMEKTEFDMRHSTLAKEIEKKLLSRPTKDQIKTLFSEFQEEFEDLKKETDQ